MQTSQKAFAVVVGICLIALAVYAVSIGVKKVRGEGFKDFNYAGIGSLVGVIVIAVVIFGGLKYLQHRG